MVKLKNYNGVVKHFVLLLTFTAVISCAEKKYVITKIEGKEIGITVANSEASHDHVMFFVREVIQDYIEYI